MKNTKQKLTIVAIIAIAVTFVLFLVYILQKKGLTSTPITITSSTPLNNSSGVSVFDPLTITLNQNVDSATINVSSSPTENWTVSQTTPGTIKIDHALYLRVSTTYKLTISQHGNTIGTLTFETAHEQNDPRLLQNLKSQLDKDYPLASLTPYVTSNYRVVYSAPLTLEIDINGPIDTQKAISEVKSWVSSNGVDSSTHKYVVVNTPPTP